MSYPTDRPRRLRSHPQLRRLAAESRLSPDCLIYPLFVCPGRNVRHPIPSMPGQHRLSIDLLVAECQAVEQLGLPAVLLFGLPENKDARGTGGYAADGIIQRAVEAIKERCKVLLVMTDVCLCEYTDHGHCGTVSDDPRQGTVDNDATLPLLAETALSHARAGADLVAPSAMMDGQVGAIRNVLDEHDFSNTPIMAYAAKYASAMYGPFRDAADSAPQFGDRKGYQMDPANAAEALREVQLDLEEGADIVMVKPAVHFMDVIYRVKQKFGVPTAAYFVSGEFSQIKAAAERGWLDEPSAAIESHTSLVRAGADMILTYYAKELLSWL